jgi:hypothetical protein
MKQTWARQDEKSGLQSRARQLLDLLLSAGDEGSVRVNFDDADVVALMVEQDLVEVETLDRVMTIRLKRWDKF